MKKKITKASTLLLAASLLFLSVARGEEVLRKLKVVTEQANIRLKPSIGSIIIKQVPEGTILESTGQEGEWFLIQLTPESQVMFMTAWLSLLKALQKSKKNQR